jgi:hypothetical protein
MSTTTTKLPPPEDPARRREIRTRAARYAGRNGSAKRQRYVLRKSGLSLSLRRIQQTRSEAEADQYPGVPQHLLSWIDGLARDPQTVPWGLVAGLIDTLAEVEASEADGCRRTLLREASEWETRHQGPTDVAQVVLARRWCRETLEDLIDTGSQELEALARMIGLARCALREGV